MTPHWNIETYVYMYGAFIQYGFFRTDADYALDQSNIYNQYSPALKIISTFLSQMHCFVAFQLQN